jgi:hypothetical protein
MRDAQVIPARCCRFSLSRTPAFLGKSYRRGNVPQWQQAASRASWAAG